MILGKAPCPDGLSGLYYKHFEEKMNSILQENRMPGTWKEASITLISKDQDFTLTRNYRSISLFNNDYKPFASILGKRKHFCNTLFMKTRVVSYLRGS